jgi:hypothetical protein
MNHVKAKPASTRTRRGTAAIENNGAVSNKAEMRSIGHIKV